MVDLIENQTALLGGFTIMWTWKKKTWPSHHKVTRLVSTSPQG